MKILGKSRGVAAVLAVAIGLAVVPASAQLAPTGLPTPPPVPAAKPTTPPAPAPGGPAAPAAKPAAPGGPSAPGGSTAPAAPAKPVDPKVAMASGEKKFKAADYAGALADFEAANAPKATPEGDRFIGLCQDNLGHFAEAVVAYEKFLANVPAKMKEQGDETKKRVEAIKAMPGKVHIATTPPGASVTVDKAANPNAAPESTPTPTDVELKPGKHTISITAEGHEPTEKEVDVTFASKQELKVELSKTAEPPPPPPPPVAAEPVAPAPTPPPPPPEPRSKVPAYVTGAVAIVAAGVGIGFGIKALGQSSDFDKNPTTKTADDGENNALVADMMFGIAITFGVTSAVLFLSNDAPQTAKGAPPKSAPVQAAQTRRAPPPKVTVTPTPFVTPSGGGAGALVRF